MYVCTIENPLLLSARMSFCSHYTDDFFPQFLQSFRCFLLIEHSHQIKIEVVRVRESNKKHLKHENRVSIIEKVTKNLLREILEPGKK